MHVVVSPSILVIHGDHIVLGGADGHLPDEPGSAELNNAGLPEPGHNVSVVGLLCHRASS